jgi:hypothetical protein
MIEKLRALLFEPHYPQRYIGRHRAPNSAPIVNMATRRPRSASV